LIVGDPDVAVAIDEDAVRRDYHPGAETLHELARRIELQDRIDGRRLEAPTVAAAALGDPDAAAVLVDVDRARRSPCTAFRKLRPALDALIGIGQIVGGLNVGLSKANRRQYNRQRRAGNRRRK